jgi:hypothetical protein
MLERLLRGLHAGLVLMPVEAHGGERPIAVDVDGIGRITKRAAALTMASLAGLSRHRRPCTDCGHIALPIVLIGVPFMVPPPTLGRDNWTMARRRLSPYRSRASPSRKLPALTNFARPSLSCARAKPIAIPTMRFYCTSAMNDLLKKAMVLNAPRLPGELLRVGHRG